MSTLERALLCVYAAAFIFIGAPLWLRIAMRQYSRGIQWTPAAAAAGMCLVAAGFILAVAIGGFLL